VKSLHLIRGLTTLNCYTSFIACVAVHKALTIWSCQVTARSSVLREQLTHTVSPGLHRNHIPGLHNNKERRMNTVVTASATAKRERRAILKSVSFVLWRLSVPDSFFEHAVSWDVTWLSSLSARTVRQYPQSREMLLNAKWTNMTRMIIIPTYIMLMTTSNLALDTGYPAWRSSLFPSALLGRF
jgi:hypothetical protein